MTNKETLRYLHLLKKFSNDAEFAELLMLLNSRSANKRMYQIMKEGAHNTIWNTFDLLLMDLEDIRTDAYDSVGGIY